MKILLEEFRALPDYRKNKVKYTNPGEILFLSLLATMSGANSFKDMVLWMKERKREKGISSLRLQHILKKNISKDHSKRSRLCGTSERKQ